MNVYFRNNIQLPAFIIYSVRINVYTHTPHIARVVGNAHDTPLKHVRLCVLANHVTPCVHVVSMHSFAECAPTHMGWGWWIYTRRRRSILFRGRCALCIMCPCVAWKHASPKWTYTNTALIDEHRHIDIMRHTCIVLLWNRQYECYVYKL